MRPDFDERGTCLQLIHTLAADYYDGNNFFTMVDGVKKVNILHCLLLPSFNLIAVLFQKAFHLTTLYDGSNILRQRSFLPEIVQGFQRILLASERLLCKARS